MAGDPFAVLGVRPDATLEEVRVARRRLARGAHPDHGGDEARMREINEAFDQAVKAILRPSAATRAPPPPPPAPAPSRRHGPPGPRVATIQHDSPSFTIDVLPAEAFEALLAAASWLGDVLVGDPPYLLEVRISDPSCWCRLELLPEAGGSSVSLTVAGDVDVDAIRDLWVGALNG
ncbi:MAG: hypothetical protein QOD72_1311 [Acidimicrobiaceae bacterium]|jgi:hypothetical protein|nr:hypothetical protein [Acidimicrobiaceae bacterium]